MKKLFRIISVLVSVLTLSGCANSAELPQITLVKYRVDNTDYPYAAFEKNKQVRSITVYTNDGKIFSAEFEGSGYKDDPAWINPNSDDRYERLTELAGGEPSGVISEREQALIIDNYENFSEWTALEMTDCGTIYDYMDVTELYVVFEDGGETRVEKLAELSCSPNCRDSAAVRKFAGALLGSPFPSDD